MSRVFCYFMIVTIELLRTTDCPPSDNGYLPSPNLTATPPTSVMRFFLISDKSTPRIFQGI